MTYEEYKNNKKSSKKDNILKKLFNKLFTIIIFVLLVMIISNISPEFRTFVNDKVLNQTLDFSKVNKLTNKITDVFKENNNDVKVVEIEEKSTKYLDGLKYINNGNVKLKNSGIITFIGEKKGYGNTIVVQQSNGYYAWYGNIKETVKLYDYIEKGEIIGTSDEEYYYVLFKDDKIVDLNDY